MMEWGCTKTTPFLDLITARGKRGGLCMDVKAKVDAYNTEIDTLFSVWRLKCNGKDINHDADGFIKDGIINPSTWFRSACRPLFLLKEAYNGNGSNDSWNLCEWIRSGYESVSKINTWMTISLWAQGIMHTDAESIYHLPNEAEQKKVGISYLDNIAVVNLRKSGGKKASSHNVLKDYVEFDKFELRDEITFIQPTVVICGGTFRYIKDILGDNLTYIGDVPYIKLNDKNILILDYYHPACRYPKLMKYYGLLGMYQAALLKMKCALG